MRLQIRTVHRPRSWFVLTGNLTGVRGKPNVVESADNNKGEPEIEADLVIEGGTKYYVELGDSDRGEASIVTDVENSEGREG